MMASANMNKSQDIMFLSENNPTVSVLMPSFNSGIYIESAVKSVLSQPCCLELVVADGGSTDGSLETLEALSSDDSRLRIISRSDYGPADGLNKAFLEARGTLIGWLNADDLYAPGALARAVASFQTHPEWLMVYGEGEEFNEETGLIQRYPTLPAAVGLNGFLSHCFICQPSVVFRRSMGMLLGTFDNQWRTAFDFDYWLRAFKAFPHRIGYIPHLQGRTRLHSDTITASQRAQVALEATELLSRYFGPADSKHLHNYALELQSGLAQIPEGACLSTHLKEVFEKGRPFLATSAFSWLQEKWLSNGINKYPKKTLVSWQSDFIPVQKSKPIVPFDQRPFGVNVIGHAFEMFGIGEDIRMAVQALQAADVPCCVIYHPAYNGASCDDRSLEPLICSDPLGGPYAFNLVCMAAPIHARWLREVGCDPLRERYTICSWPWETQQWPAEWMPLLSVADELWPSSHFTEKALSYPAAKAARPLTVMPMAAEIIDPDRFCDPIARSATRNRYGLSAEKILFIYSFDFNSTAIRKNPMGALEAFQRAFPLPNLLSSFGFEDTTHNLSDRVSLVIKTFLPKKDIPSWQWLQARIGEDPRIQLIAAPLSRDDLLSLYGCCDVFLSLHRSEGFGRGIAEALQLGLDVIATDFGGNTDFCTGPLSHPVRWKRVPIPRGQYPYADDHYWAEPDLDHAVQLCQQLAESRNKLFFRKDKSDFGYSPHHLSKYRKLFSFSSVGSKMRQRLETLWLERESLAHNLSWRTHYSQIPSNYL